MPFPDAHSFSYGLKRQKGIYDRAATSFRETIRPNAQLRALIESARAEMLAQIRSYLGVHVRRGDQKAMSWKYRNGYVALGEFTQGIASTVDRLVEDGQIAAGAPLAVWVASDAGGAADELDAAHAELRG